MTKDVADLPSLREALQELVDAREAEAKANMAYENAQANFTNPWPEQNAAFDAVMRASKAEKTARAVLAALEERPIDARAERAAVPAFQQRMREWAVACFGQQIADDKAERNHRFLEEALELVQALGCTQAHAHELVDYVYTRAAGEPRQEVGGAITTLSALCSAQGFDLMGCAEAELARIWTKVDVIRAKQAAKPKGSPLAAVPASVVPAEPIGYRYWSRAGKGGSSRWSYAKPGAQPPLAEPIFSAAQLGALQAKIDALMFEYCPDEMTPEQLSNWAAHQRPASAEIQRAVAEALSPAQPSADSAGGTEEGER